MTNEELIVKIKAEIDKRYTEYREKMKSDDFTYYEGMADALDLFEQFIDTFESEKPMNPEEAMKELDEKIALVKQRGTWDGVDVDKYMDEVRGREPSLPSDVEEAAKEYAKTTFKKPYSDNPDEEVTIVEPDKYAGFIAGAKWDREQMMSKAVKSEVTETCGISSVWIKTQQFKPGQKVRIIIVKEDSHE